MVLTTGPRCGTVVTRPSASSNRSASRMDGRLTPVISHSSRSTRRWPGFSVPDMIASRSFCATLDRTVGTSAIRSVDCKSARLSIVFRLPSSAMTPMAPPLPPTAIGAGSIAIYGQNHHLRNLNMGWLVQRKHDRSSDIGRIERHLELVEIVSLLLLVAAVARENDARPRQAGLHFGHPYCRLGKFAPERFGKHMHAGLARAVGGHFRNDAYGVDRTHVDDVARVAPDHVGEDAARHPHQADQVGLNDVGPIVGRTDVETGPAADIMPGVVDEDVDRPKGLRNMIGQALHTLGVCNIHLDRKRIVAHFSGELAKGFRSAI